MFGPSENDTSAVRLVAAARPTGGQICRRKRRQFARNIVVVRVRRRAFALSPNIDRVNDGSPRPRAGRRTTGTGRKRRSRRSSNTTGVACRREKNNHENAARGRIRESDGGFGLRFDFLCRSFSLSLSLWAQQTGAADRPKAAARCY